MSSIVMLPFFLFWDGVSLLLPRLECSGAISAHSNLRLLGSSNSPSSAAAFTIYALMSYFCKSVFLNVSTFNPIHSGSLLFLEVDSSSECFMTAIAEGLLSESGWIITLNNSVNSWESTCGIRGNLFSLIPWHWSPFLRRAQTSSTDNCEGKCKISAFGRWYNSPVKLHLQKEKKRKDHQSLQLVG